MNIKKNSHAIFDLGNKLFTKLRLFFAKKKCSAFNVLNIGKNKEYIEKIYVINLDRQPERFARIQSEFSRITDSSQNRLIGILERVSAIDAVNLENDIHADYVNSKYTLGEQLFVDPYQVLPKGINLDMEISMSKQEIAVALSHIKVWKKIASGDEPYVFVIEDDICLHPRFSNLMESSWNEIKNREKGSDLFDILFVSFKEVDLGAEKTKYTNNTFQLFRGIWYMSGYVLSKEGAKKLIEQLPLRGPVDLWINHKFDRIKALMTKQSIVPQRSDEVSGNFYSVMPILSKIGVINDGGPSIFKNRPTTLPVFVIGKKSGKLTTIAMALSMLGFRCCSDLDKLPMSDKESLIKNLSDRKFDAYVNVKYIDDHLDELCQIYPDAHLIVLSSGFLREELDKIGKDWLDRLLVLDEKQLINWKPICEFFGLVPPVSPFPDLLELGQRKGGHEEKQTSNNLNSKWLEADDSPWILPQSSDWQGLELEPVNLISKATTEENDEFEENFQINNRDIWLLRDDTFPGNECMFSPSNLSVNKDYSYVFTAKKQNMEVRKYSSAAITTHKSFLYGRFEAELKTPKISGFVTGIFLHRDSPRQEIDIEFTGNDPTKILTNVYYNPGVEGARFDYGYRGTPLQIDLGFDASEEFHLYAIEWEANEIRWYVDNVLIHTRKSWAPTPIPHLPMQFHVNLWPTKSRELAGKIDDSKLPINLFVKSAKAKQQVEAIIDEPINIDTLNKRVHELEEA